MNTQRIIIAGGGIGGLAAALGLLQAGHRVRVCERTRQLAEVGAGLTITPNAAHVLHALGVWEAVRESAVFPATGAVCNGVTGQTLGVREFGDKVTRECGAEYLHVHRADLHQALLDGVRAIDADAVSLGDEFVALEENTPARVRARFTRSGRLEADMLLGADGLRSQVRVALFGPEAPAFAGYVAYRGLVPVETLAPSLLEHASCMSVGPRNLFLRYLVSAGKQLNVVCIGRSDDWAQESWSVPATREELLGLLQGWHADVIAVALAIPADSLFKWGVFERSALSRWHAGRVALLGDAAHPMQPFLGQGAVMALEDAAVLARVMTQGQDISAALACYERVRLPRANQVMTQSADNGRRLVPRTGKDYNPGSHASPASLGLMAYNPVTVSLQ